MMLLTGVTDQQANKQVCMTHDTETRNGVVKAHYIRFYSGSVPVWSSLIGTYVLTPQQARELKAHL